MDAKVKVIVEFEFSTQDFGLNPFCPDEEFVEAIMDYTDEYIAARGIDNHTTADIEIY